jgi:type II secretory pathway pseudopilin PulG
MSLLEALTALVVTGTLAQAAAVGLGRFADRSRVDGSAAVVLTAYREAQSVARTWGRPTEVVVAADSVVVRALGPADSAVVWRRPGPAGSGVALTPATHVASFTSNGVAAGVGNVTHVLSRGGSVRQVVVSRLGRTRIWP